MTREMTNRLLEAVEEGLLNRDDVILACVNYMSEDDVADLCASEFALGPLGWLDDDDS